MAHATATDIGIALCAFGLGFALVALVIGAITTELDVAHAIDDYLLWVVIICVVIVAFGLGLQNAVWFSRC
jgi:hypothetical protein